MGPDGAQPASANGSSQLDHLQPSDEDLLYEEELLRNPYSLKMWVRYLEARRDAPARRRYILYERALKALPVSYKVRQQPTDPQYCLHPYTKGDVPSCYLVKLT